MMKDSQTDHTRSKNGRKQGRLLAVVSAEAVMPMEAFLLAICNVRQADLCSRNNIRTSGNLRYPHIRGIFVQIIQDVLKYSNNNRFRPIRSNINIKDAEEREWKNTRGIE